jgi:D-alanyl-D-alanine carboxypeptidase
MAVSLNGWPVLKPGSSLLATGTVPGTKIHLTCHKVVLPLMLAVAYDYAAWIRPLRANCTGGYAYRQATSGAGWSCHSSGTAIDINWLYEGAQKASNKVFWSTVTNHKAVDQIMEVYDVLEWGGFWSKAFYDPMHWQVSQHANATKVAAKIKFLGIDSKGVRHNNWAGKPLPEPRG